MQRKHMLGMVLIVALVVSGVGLLTVGAQDDDPAWLGVAVTNADDGVTVAELIPDGPAESAGVRVGDVVTAVNDTEVTDVQQFIEVITSFAPGDEIALVVLRGDEELSLPVTLGSRPDTIDFSTGPTIQMGPGMQGEMVLFGVQMTMSDDGLVIESIDENSPLADAGLEAGDVVVAINGEPVEDLLPRLMMRAMWEDAVTFTVQRDGEERDVTIDFADLLGDFEHPPFTMDVPEVRRPLQLGVQFRTLDASIAAEEDLPVNDGALITEVFEDTPAADAGLQTDDIITAVDGDLVDEEHTLRDRLYAYEDGDVVTLTVLRDGEELEVEATLGPNPRDMGARGMPFFGPGMMMPFHEGRHGGFRFGMPEDFFEMHPFMGQGMDMMPGGGFHFRFDTPDDGGATDGGAIQVMPDANNTSA